LQGIDPKKIERYRDFINYYSTPEIEAEEHREEDYNTVLRMLKHG
jgi:hypothetical protein